VRLGSRVFMCGSVGFKMRYVPLRIVSCSKVALRLVRSRKIFVGFRYVYLG